MASETTLLTVSATVACAAIEALNERRAAGLTFAYITPQGRVMGRLLLTIPMVQIDITGSTTEIVAQYCAACSLLAAS